MLNMGLYLYVCSWDVCAKKFKQLLRFADICLHSFAKKKNRNFTLEISNISLFLMVDMSRGHHSASSSPPLLPSGLILSESESSSLSAVFSSVDACHICSTLASSSASESNRSYVIQAQKRHQTKWGVYAEFYLQMLFLITGTRAPSERQVNSA